MIKRFLILACASLMLFGGARFAAAQDSTSGDPLADAARKAQAQKKTEPKPSKVYTDDNIGGVQGQVSVVGQAPEGAATSSEQTADKEKTPSEKKDEAYYKKKFGELHRKLDDDEKELDVLQREYSLKQQQYYSDPNTAMKEQYTRQDLTDTSTAIDKKKQDIADDNQAISDLEDDMRRNGGDAGWEREDAPPVSSSSSMPETPASPEAAEPPAGSQPGQPGEVVAPSDTSTPPPTPAPEPSTSTPPSS